jgi:hypothetical protein
MSTRHLRQVIQRDVRTHYTISEVLECGHRYESLVLLSDSLTAKYRTCITCAKQMSPALPPAKPAMSAVLPGTRRDLA